MRPNVETLWMMPLVVAAATQLVACGSGDSPGSGESPQMGTARATLTSVPAGVLCIRIDVAPASITKTFDVSAGASSASLDVGRVPAGEAAFRADAFNVACSYVNAGTPADYVSDPVTVTVTPGFDPDVSLTLVPNISTHVGVDFQEPVSSLWCGQYSTYAITTSGVVKAWGNDFSGILGDGTAADSRTSPVVATEITSATSIGASAYHACYVTAEGALKCIGSNAAGELGDGTTDSKTTWVMSFAAGVVQVGVGTFHTCIRLTDESIRCVGSNGYGQLGNGTKDGATAWQTTARPGSATDLAVGPNAGCYRSKQGLVYCWGDNEYGQLANGSDGNAILTPSAVAYSVDGGATSSNLSAVRAMSVGASDSCFLKQDGTAWCAGLNGGGILGNGTSTDGSYATQVSGLSDAQEVAVGSGHACTRNMDGSVLCWGNGAFGELGDGSGTNAATPVPIPGLTATALCVDSEHSCARSQSGALQCWGRNYYGELGDGTNEFRYSPTAVLW